MTAVGGAGADVGHPPPPGHTTLHHDDPRVRWGLGQAALVVPFLAVGVALAAPFTGRGEVAEDTAFTLAFGAALVAPVLVASHRRGRRSLRDDFGWRLPTRGDLGVGVAVGLVLMALTVAVSAALEAAVGSVPSNNELVTDPPSAGAAAVVAVLAAVVVAPVTEELYFRGLLLRATMRRIPTVPAVVLVAAAFSAVHGLDLGENGWTLPASMFPGDLVLTWLAVRRQGLPACVVAHATFNGIATAASFVT